MRSLHCTDEARGSSQVCSTCLITQPHIKHILQPQYSQVPTSSKVSQYHPPSSSSPCRLSAPSAMGRVIVFKSKLTCSTGQGL